MSDQSHFGKELYNNLFYVNGAAVQFELLDGNRGVLVLDNQKDAAIIAALNTAAQKRVGGILKLSQEQYVQKKTLKVSPRLPSPFNEPLRVHNPPKKPKPQESPVVEPVKSESNGYPVPVEAPELSFRPTTKRLSSVLKEPKT